MKRKPVQTWPGAAGLVRPQLVRADLDRVLAAVRVGQLEAQLVERIADQRAG